MVAFLTPRSSFLISLLVRDPLHQSPQLRRTELVEARLDVACSPLEEDPRAGDRASTRHKMNATARSSVRAVAFTLEKHVPRRGPAPQLSHELGADAREERNLVVWERGAQGAQGCRSAQGAGTITGES